MGKIPDVVLLAPTISPASLMLLASLKVPPNVPRSVIVPFCQRKACWNPEDVLLSPTTCPRPLMPEATLKLPPRVPKSVIVRPANSGCLNADSEDGNTPTAPIPLSYAVPAGPNSFHAKTLPGVRAMLVSAARSAAWGQDESNSTFPGTRSSMGVFHWQGSALRLGLGARPPGPVNRGPREVDTAPSVLGSQVRGEVGTSPIRILRPSRSLDCPRMTAGESDVTSMSAGCNGSGEEGARTRP